MKKKPQDPYTISYKEHTSACEEAILLEGIIREASIAKGMSRIQPYAFFLKDSQDKILGGIKGATIYGCLYVDLLWVEAKFRGQGFGSKLLHACEKLGFERHCTFATLTTMDWEALPFYQKLGYEIEYIREGYENNSKMYILRKPL